VAGDKTDVVRDLAGRVGPIVGSALACRDIARPRIQVIVDKFKAVITEASSNEAERSDLTQAFDRGVADGRGAVTTGRTDCRSADRQLADLERSIAGPGPGPSEAAVTAPSSAAAATAPTAPEPVAAGSPVRGVTDQEIRFGMAAPFSGSAKELGRQMKLGIDTAFNRVNDAGGVEGRCLS
jgi:branched-chain amino acid transport system substrate-binding protein